jgi:hypothetical protein
MTTTTKPKSDLEIYQALRIEALERELLKAKELLTEIQIGIETYVNEIEVKEVEILK